MFKKLMNNNGKSATASNEIKTHKNPIAELEVDWITGYKSVTYDLRAFHGDFQYEINKLYEVETINPCRNGYHFCLDVENAYKNRRGDYGVRVFKVRAHVPGKRTLDGVFNPVSCAELLDLLDSDPYNFSPSFGRINNNFMHANKYVAYKIELLEEVPYEEYQEFTKVKDINTKELYQTLNTQVKYYDWKINKLATYAVENGYSRAFILEYLKQFTNHKLSIPNCIEIITDSIKLVSLEKISFDTRVILLNAIINQKITNS